MNSHKFLLSYYKLLRMDTNQQAQGSFIPPPPPPGVFGTKIPSTVTFAVAILLFLLPFVEVKCGGNTLVNKSGLDIAIHNDWNAASSFYNKEELQKKNHSDEKEGNSQIFAIAALGLGVIGLLLSLAKAKSAWTGATISGVLSAAALIGLMIDMKKWFNDSMAKDVTDKAGDEAGKSGMREMGDYLNNVKPALNFTPWFYIAVIAFLVAAFFCYRRMSIVK
jgi:hypothetical protein